jgi:uncharacterized protein HemX
MLGYEGGAILVAVLLVLALGLAGALWAATRDEARPRNGEARRSR